MPSKVLVTAALPYANGSIHLGHMLEAIQTDVYVRARKLGGKDVVFMWADDTHGTPIQLRARKEGIEPEVLIARAYKEHLEDYTAFQIGFDVFHTTHSDEVRRHVESMFQALEQRGDVTVREVQQLYCPNDRMFLPDRFVRGTCPRCRAVDQYGDSCEVCGGTYAPTEVIDPRCAICGVEPIVKASSHVFVPLDRHEAFLREWLRPAEKGGKTVLQPTVRNYVMTWVEEGLRDWDISRDGPYFGFEIPGHPGKYFYVWFDAPVGYVGATEKWCRDHGVDFEQYWRNPGGDTEIVHVIGKDIVYFHCLFWPAVLNAVGYTTPSQVHVHGWLMVNGEKMSKSRGTFILARTYLEHLPADYLRYYLAAKLGPGQDDIDLSLEDFVHRVNADLVKKAANLASRCVKFVYSRLDGRLGTIPQDAEALLETARGREREAAELYAAFDHARALRLAMETAQEFNLYLTEQAPWKRIKDDPEAARAVCTAGILAVISIATILKPVVPTWAAKVERFLRLPQPLSFVSPAQPLPAGHQIGEYETLAEPIEMSQVHALIEASKESLSGTDTQAPDAATHADVPELAPETTIDAFLPIDLRVGVVRECTRVEGSDKLLRLVVDLGQLGTRNIFSGIGPSYAPESLLGKHVVVYANLKPRKMRFGVSEGMVLAAGDSDDAITVLELDPQRSRPGDKIS